MTDAEIKKRIESSFQPHHCGVEPGPVMGSEVLEDGFWIKVSDKDDTLPPYTPKTTLKAVRHDIDQLIKSWREEAAAKGYQLDPR